MSTSVKLIHSGMAGAPSLANVAGDLVTVLNAALVDGFGSNTVDSIVIAGGVATVTRGAGHPFDVGAVALISGATTTSGTVNGERRVLAVTATTYTFDATGIGNQTATGTISHGVAPLGWGRPFAGSSTLQVYRSADVTGTRLYLRVDDTGTTNGRVVGYETMGDDSSGTGPFPTAAQQSGGLYWPKSEGGARPWMVVGDGRMFYVWAQYNSLGSGASHLAAFGDPVSRKSPDPYGCLITGQSSNVVSSGAASTSDWSYSAASPQSAFFARGVSGVGSAAPFARVAAHPRGAQNLHSGEASTNHLGFPNPADGSLYVVPITLQEPSPSCYRADAPGVYFLPHNIGVGVFAARDRINGVTGYAGRTFTAFPSYVGTTFFDTTGPWR